MDSKMGKPAGQFLLPVAQQCSPCGDSGRRSSGHQDFPAPTSEMKPQIKKIKKKKPHSSPVAMPGSLQPQGSQLAPTTMEWLCPPHPSPDTGPTQHLRTAMCQSPPELPHPSWKPSERRRGLIGGPAHYTCIVSVHYVRKCSRYYLFTCLTLLINSGVSSAFQELL